MSSILSLDELVTLGHFRWAGPLLADLAAHKGGRFVAILHRLSISRESLSRTLEGLIAAGWVMRNPGHGHPLRPEYILTATGERLATAAARIQAAQMHIGLTPEQMARWSLPIVRVIASGQQRFNDIARALPTSNPRALSQGLQNLIRQTLVERSLIDGRPPATLYALTPDGVWLAQAA